MIDKTADPDQGLVVQSIHSLTKLLVPPWGDEGQTDSVPEVCNYGSAEPLGERRFENWTKKKGS